MVEIHGSSPLTARGHSQLLADDLNPGSHLEVGDLEKRWMCPSGRLEGTPVTSRPETARAVEPALAAIRLEISIPKIDGVSEYPVPTYPEPDGSGLCPRVTMISDDELDAATVKAIESMNRLMFAVDIKEVASNKDQTVHQTKNQIRRFERLWRQRVRRTP